MDNLETQLEALLFYKGETMSLKQLSAAVGKDEVAIEEALESLRNNVAHRGIRLIEENKRYALATAPEAKELIEKIRKEELEGPLGKAGLETLAIIIYRNPISRAEVDYIRGVNSTTTLRTLTMRGLVEKIENPHDKRSYLYQPTTELPAALGVTSLNELPEFEQIQKEIQSALQEKETSENETARADHEEG